MKDIENHLFEATWQLGETIRRRIRAMDNLQHELRTPMNSVIGLSALLKDEMNHAEQLMYVQMIHESSIRLEQTIERVRQLSQVESLALAPTMKLTNLSPVIREVASGYVQSMKAGGLEFRIEVGGERVAALVDAERLKQALAQLLDNALKFTSHGSIQIRLREIVEGEVSYAEVSVLDTGIGIPEECHEAVFESYRQVSEGPCRKYQGMGLGLMLAKSMVEQMNGRIDLHSEPRKGTRVSVRFPKTPYQAADERIDDHPMHNQSP